MKTIYNIKYWLLLLSMLGLLIGCSDDEKDEYYAKAKEISFQNSKDLVSVNLLAPKDTVVRVKAQLSSMSSQHIIAEVEVDNSLIAIYNKKHGTEYKELSPQAYDLSMDQVIIPRYSEESTHLEIRLRTAPLKDADKYLLPIKIASTTGDENLTLAPDSSVLYILFSKKDVPPIPFIFLQDVELTTVIGEGKKNWFSAYATNSEGGHTFGVKEAAEKSEMMDFVLIKHGSDLKFHPSIIGKQHGGAYLANMTPYTKGFKKLTHLFHPGPTGAAVPTIADFEAVNSNEEMQLKVAELNKRGYGVYYTGDRMTTTNLLSTPVLVQGWGPMIGKNENFAIMHIKQITPINDGADYSIKFDIKYFGHDVRTEYANAPNQNVVVDNPDYNVNNEIKEYKGVELTTEIGEGKKNWFSAYAGGSTTFTQEEAKTKSAMMDFAIIKFGDGDVRLNPAIIGKQHGGDHQTRIAPYVEGFSKLTYTLIGGQRKGSKDETKPEHYDKVTDIVSLKAQIEEYRTLGYNYMAANRMMTDKLAVGSVAVIGWGNTIGKNEAVGMLIVRSIEATEGGHYKVKLDIKVPVSDSRTPNNGSAVANP